VFCCTDGVGADALGVGVPGAERYSVESTRIERLPSEHEDVCRVVGKDQGNVKGKSTEMRRRTGLAARKKFDTGLGLVFGNGEPIGRQAR
jgi:hypothetical protein